MNADKKNTQPYSDTSIRRAVQVNSVQHPLVLYPCAAGLLGGIALGLLGVSTPLMAIAGIGSTLGLGALVTNYFFRRDHFKGLYIRKIHADIVKQREDRLTTLKQGLEAVVSSRGLGQLERLKEKFELLQKVLGSKLQQGELTYERYLCMSEQVYLSALDNLQGVVDRLESVNAIDETFIRKRIGELELHDASGDASDNKELNALKERLLLLLNQHGEADSLLGENEGAMTKIDSTTAALATIKTKKGHAIVDMETAMVELEKMANRAQDYSL